MAFDEQTAKAGGALQARVTQIVAFSKTFSASLTPDI
jgi:hypothetical protein